MPVEYEIDQSTQTIRTRCFGPLTLEEVIQHFRDLRADPACPSYLNVRLDLSDTTKVPMSGELREAARQIALIRDRVHFGACAVVAPRSVMYGMSRMFLVFADDLFDRSAVFRTVVEAEVWLTEQQVRTRGAV